MPFNKNGEIIERNKGNKARTFCEQVISGIQNYYWFRKNYKIETYQNRIVCHIIILILITSSNYYYCKELPPKSIESLEEKNVIIYLFNPSKPLILDQWRIPIIIVSEDYLEKFIKALLLTFKKNFWRNLQKS